MPPPRQSESLADVFRDHPLDQDHRPPVLSRAAFGAGRKPLCLGLSRAHRERRQRDGAVAEPPLAHHRRDRPPAGGARPRRRRRAAGPRPRRELRIHLGVPVADPLGHHGRRLRDDDGNRRALSRACPGLLARQPADADPAQLSLPRRITRKRAHAVDRRTECDRPEPARQAPADPPPDPVVRAYREYFSGYSEDPVALLQRTFEETDGYDEIVMLKDIRFESHCEHHMAPIIGKVHIAYLPNNRVVGISKLARLVEVYAKRLQIQEKMTAQIANTLDEVLQPKGVAVVIEAAHQCMTTRGVHKPGVTMVTSRMLGAFRTDPSSRREVLSMIGTPGEAKLHNV